MRELMISQAYEGQGLVEHTFGTATEFNEAHSTITEKGYPSLELTELTQQVYRLAERAKTLLGRPDCEFDEDTVPPEALAALASIEAQTNWTMDARSETSHYRPAEMPIEDDHGLSRVKNIHDVLRQKEAEVAKLQAEIEALRRVLPLLAAESEVAQTLPASRGAMSRQMVCIP